MKCFLQHGHRILLTRDCSVVFRFRVMSNQSQSKKLCGEGRLDGVAVVEGECQC
jgi:hypothetical protein